VIDLGGTTGISLPSHSGREIFICIYVTPALQQTQCGASVARSALALSDEAISEHVEKDCLEQQNTALATPHLRWVQV
jgi:hypothetical protein